MKFMNYIFAYLCIFLVACILNIIINPMNMFMYYLGIKHIDYFLWTAYIFNGNILWTYYLRYLVFLIVFIFSFPLITLVPNWHKIINTGGVLHVLACSLHNNKELSKKIQNKLFWYYCFNENNIKTPKIYCYYQDSKPNYINDLDSHEYILKPIYGTQGQNITKIHENEINQNIKNGDILQEYITDCYVNGARHFRINTLYYNSASIFSIEEIKQAKENKIASNHANGGNITLCYNNCDFLSNDETKQIDSINKQLLNLHTSQFTDIPLIGWDVCLTCNGPYVFEGNLGSEIDYYYDDYIKIMENIYSSKMKGPLF